MSVNIECSRDGFRVAGTKYKESAGLGKIIQACASDSQSSFSSTPSVPCNNNIFAFSSGYK